MINVVDESGETESEGRQDERESADCGGSTRRNNFTSIRRKHCVNTSSVC